MTVNAYPDKQLARERDLGAGVDTARSLGAALQLADNRPEATHQGTLQAMADSSPRGQRLTTMQAMMRDNPRVNAQRRRIQDSFGSNGGLPRAQAAQRAVTEMAADSEPAQLAAVSTKSGRTGLPDNLKSGIESLSGMSMDHVKVHYNSSRPAQLNAHAYAQGSDIHLAPGQERHLPHEAWHVVQQAQGRVRPTLQMHGEVPVNDDEALEREADHMGKRAMQRKIAGSVAALPNKSQIKSQMPAEPTTVQPKWIDGGGLTYRWDELVSGAQWMYNRVNRKMWYVRNGETSQKKSREEWVKLYGSDPLANEDASIVEARSGGAAVATAAASSGASTSVTEAGDQPILVTEGVLEIKGLIMCVGVIIKVIGPPPGFATIAAIGGHFNYPTMYNEGAGKLTDAGVGFVDEIKRLADGYKREDLEAGFYIGRAAVARDDGKSSGSQREAEEAAAVLRTAIGLGGGVQIGSSSISMRLG
ncbi:DUF4157 domain-containing protein [Trinickia dinghuensis]|uniref:eCIS core domain-containing protein n=1 Tax=Trinickia dinghuensis TaxID=2291023 RepID=UPI001FE934A7|nr:DUF4157 domain-containing protein [Trinickia dinghuensis]